jgi:hypothetical protein
MKRFRIHSFPTGFDCGFVSYLLHPEHQHPQNCGVAVWLNEKGIVLMGVLYLVFGFILTRVRH